MDSSSPRPSPSTRRHVRVARAVEVFGGLAAIAVVVLVLPGVWVVGVLLGGP